MKKLIVMSIVGFVVGGVASYLYCKKRFEEGCCEEDICDIEDNSERVVGVDLGSGPDETVTIRAARTNDTVASYNVVEHSEVQTRNYSKIANKLYGESKEDTHVITEMEFSDECENYDKITVLYYDDGVVTDDRDEVMENIEETLGKNLTLFGYGSDDKDVLYVRNDKIKIDFEILKQNTTYRNDD